jgi:hypothetical protein
MSAQVVTFPSRKEIEDLARDIDLYDHLIEAAKDPRAEACQK